MPYLLRVVLLGRTQAEYPIRGGPNRKGCPLMDQSLCQEMHVMPSFVLYFTRTHWAKYLVSTAETSETSAQ